jgi:hypothetical protein
MHTVRQCNANTFATKVCPRYKKPVWEAAGAHFDKISLWTVQSVQYSFINVLDRYFYVMVFQF